MRVLELFGGIGACTAALKRMGVDVEVVDYVEIDKYATASYNAINGTDFEPQDICTWDKYLEVELIMHGSPCQDFSVAGKQAGGDVGSGTRSSLMYETIRIVGKLRPKYVIWENVKNLLSAKHRHNFDAYLEIMKALGYTNYYQVLNAKDYGIPQNRERVFTISVLGEHKPFVFPNKSALALRLKDLLEDEVEEKYYLSQKMIDGFLKHNENHTQKGTGFIWKPKTGDDVASCLRANASLAPTDNTLKSVRIGGIFDTEKSKRQAGGIWDKEQLSPTLDTMQGGWRQPSIIDTDVSCKRECTEQTLTTNDNMGVGVSYKIRRLTPKECWRLMGFDDESFEKAAKVNSNTQLYKQAGNSIVVNVLEEIFKNLFEDYKENTKDN